MNVSAKPCQEWEWSNIHHSEEFKSGITGDLHYPEWSGNGMDGPTLTLAESDFKLRKAKSFSKTSVQL